MSYFASIGKMVWLNKREAAEYLRASTRTITRYTKCPVSPLPHSFIGNQMRFHKKDLDAWILFKKPYKKLHLRLIQNMINLIQNIK